MCPLKNALKDEKESHFLTLIEIPASSLAASDRDDVDLGGVGVRVQGERGVPQGDRHDDHPLHDHAALRGLLPRRHSVQHQPGPQSHMPGCSGKQLHRGTN